VRARERCHDFLRARSDGSILLLSLQLPAEGCDQRVTTAPVAAAPRNRGYRRPPTMRTANRPPRLSRKSPEVDLSHHGAARTGLLREPRVRQHRLSLNVGIGDFGAVLAASSSLCSASAPIVASVGSRARGRQDVADSGRPALLP
jgi:hypothetical protein